MLTLSFWPLTFYKLIKFLDILERDHTPFRRHHGPTVRWCRTSFHCTVRPRWTDDTECPVPSARETRRSGSRDRRPHTPGEPGSCLPITQCAPANRLYVFAHISLRRLSVKSASQYAVKQCKSHTWTVSVDNKGTLKNTSVKCWHIMRQSALTFDWSFELKLTDCKLQPWRNVSTNLWFFYAFLLAS